VASNVIQGMDERTDSPKPGSQWLKNNLVTLGSAAVFSVYGAGYLRTRDAAERFAGEAVRRHGAALATQGPGVHAIAPPPEALAEKHSRRLPAMRQVSGAKTASEANSAPAAAKSGKSPNVASVTTSPDHQPSAAAQASAPVSAPVTAPTATPAAQPAAAAADSASGTKKEEGDGLKDGVFYGWGTSRHGDIQASVEIKGGRIVGAYISQCLTRYSCSWVSMLPGQVVSRQSAEVDYVSGATQSSNAFYYAVVEALKSAK
jgi:uncharacterized protein with FMN-binding domain